MNNQSDWKRYRDTLLMISGIIAAGSLIVLFFFRTSIFTGALRRALGILQPFLYGIAIAYLLRPVCRHTQAFLERTAKKLFPKKKVPGLRMISILFSLLLMFVIVTLLLSFLTSPLQTPLRLRSRSSTPSGMVPIFSTRRLSMSLWGVALIS